jgi:hypothetical protein
MRAGAAAAVGRAKRPAQCPGDVSVSGTSSGDAAAHSLHPTPTTEAGSLHCRSRRLGLSAHTQGFNVAPNANPCNMRTRLLHAVLRRCTAAGHRSSCLCGCACVTHPHTLVSVIAARCTGSAAALGMRPRVWPPGDAHVGAVCGRHCRASRQATDRRGVEGPRHHNRAHTASQTALPYQVRSRLPAAAPAASDACRRSTCQHAAAAACLGTTHTHMHACCLRLG